jgi:hypothetical protein
MVRDVTNMFFVIILLVIAFGTILGLEQYEYKKLLFKMIAAAVIVNFSRTICGLIIDIAQVIMVTFINGVAATAGGNLINMFNMQGVLKMAQTSGANITPKNVFLASLAALIFSAMAMATMFVFLIMLVARLVTLWVLIVLSPLAFVLNVIPQTQKYASQWWTEFGNNVVSGPIIAFFLWLAFVTAGSGNANADIVSGLPNQNLSVSGGTTESAGSAAAGISDAMDWTKMANFAIAIGMLLVGAKMAQQLGVAGGAMMGKAVDFGKKVATVASGISAARWAGRKGLAAGKAAGKFVAMKAPIVGGEAWQRRGRAIKEVAGAGLKKVGMGRDWIAKQMEKGIATEKEEAAKAKGWRGVVRRGALGLLAPGAKLVARRIESGARADKRIEFMKGWKENLGKIQEERMGLGPGWAARKAGASSKILEREKAENEIIKREALNGIASKQLHELGRHAEADALDAATYEMRNEEDKKKYKDLDQAGLLAAAIDLAKEAKSQKEAFIEAMGDKSAEEATDEAKAIADKLGELELKKRSILSVAGRRSNSDFVAVEDTLRKASGYSGDEKPEVAPQIMKSSLSGFDTVKESEFLSKMTALLSENKSKALDASNRDMHKLGSSLAANDGNMIAGLAFSQGMVLDDKYGHTKVATDFGANVGTKKLDGSDRPSEAERTPEEKRNSNVADPGSVKYVIEKMTPSFRTVNNINMVMSNERDPQDPTKMKKVLSPIIQSLLVKYLNQSSPAGMAHALTGDLKNQLKTQLSPDQFREFIRQITLGPNGLKPTLHKAFKESLGVKAEEET